MSHVVTITSIRYIGILLVQGMYYIDYFSLYGEICGG